MSTRPRPSAATMIRSGRAEGTRHVLSEQQWAELADRLHTDPLTIAGLWSDGQKVHALALEGSDAPLISSVPVEAKRFLALSPSRPLLAAQERIVRDLWGIEAMEARDLRPWLDHGVWSQTAPLSERPGPSAWPPEPPEFVWTDEDDRAGAMQLPVGPVQQLVLGPAQFRITLVGERIRRVATLLGYAHRGVAFALRAKSFAEGAALIGRIDAASGVAHQIAFAEAVEAAFEWRVDAPTRALRRGMAALERLGHRLRSAGQVSSVAALTRACGSVFGHRYMRDCIVPGGWRRTPDAYAFGDLQRVLATLDLTARFGTDPGEEAAAFAADLGRARRSFSDIGASGAEDRAVPGRGVAEGIGTAQTVHGQLFHWVRLENGTISAWHAIDPVLNRLARIEQSAVGMSLESFTAMIRRLGLSVAGADL